MDSFIDRAKDSARYYKMSLVKWQTSMGLSNAHFYNCKGLSRKVAKLIEEKYPEINTTWLATGKGQMLNRAEEYTDIENYLVPLLPIAAQGGTEEDIQSKLDDTDGEKVLCPIKGADLAITINGDSMSPEYPRGCTVFAQRVNDTMFIEWGSTYVLDTTNGVVVKNVFPGKEGSDNVTCRSVNPNYAEFSIAKSDIRAWYKVRCCITIK